LEINGRYLMEATTLLCLSIGEIVIGNLCRI
jgi:hypothetical protein